MLRILLYPPFLLFDFVFTTFLACAIFLVNKLLSHPSSGIWFLSPPPLPESFKMEMYCERMMDGDEVSHIQILNPAPYFSTTNSLEKGETSNQQPFTVY